jgi:hypothetical protein
MDSLIRLLFVLRALLARVCILPELGLLFVERDRLLTGLLVLDAFLFVALGLFLPVVDFLRVVDLDLADRDLVLVALGLVVVDFLRPDLPSFTFLL